MGKYTTAMMENGQDARRQRRRRLYHVTLGDAVESILMEGQLDPLRARGTPRVWLVERSGVTWAIAHVAAGHERGIEDLVVIPVLVVSEILKRSGHRGVFYVDQPIRILEALDLICASDWLAEEDCEPYRRPAWMEARASKRSEERVIPPVPQVGG